MRRLLNCNPEPVFERFQALLKIGLGNKFRQNMLGQRFGCSAFDARRFEGLHIGERVDGHLSPLLCLFSSLIGEVLAVRKRYPFATWCPARCSRTRTTPEWSQPVPPNAAA